LLSIFKTLRNPLIINYLHHSALSIINYPLLAVFLHLKF
jgi:hypothetical protein